MASCNFLFHWVVLFFSCYSNKLYVFGAREVANHYHVVQRKSLKPATTCSASTRGSQGILVYHRYGPCSPLSQENSSQNSHQFFVQDQSRVNSINSMNGLGTRIPVFGRSIGAGNFVVTVGFGTPKKDYTLILDTGSDLTWIQCEPCSVYCYPQGPIYDPKSSSSFSTNVSCSSSCNYQENYADKSYSSGYFVKDTLTLSPTDVYPNFIFGCGQNNSNDFGSASGMLGIGQDTGLSLVSQTATNFAKIFCYCLPSTESSTGYLLFGLQALETCQTKNFTPLLRDPKRPVFYFVTLNGISITIGQQRLNIASQVSSKLSTIIDSGTIITRLPPSVYSQLRSAFQKSMSQYPIAAPSGLLDTCYNLTGVINSVKIPNMVLHFAQVDVNLDPSAVIWIEGDSQVCLAFIGNKNASELTIIGNHQQRALNILYNIQDAKLEFGVGSCGK